MSVYWESWMIATETTKIEIGQPVNIIDSCTVTLLLKDGILLSSVLGVEWSADLRALERMRTCSSHTVSDLRAVIRELCTSWVVFRIEFYRDRTGGEEQTIRPNNFDSEILKQMSCCLGTYRQYIYTGYVSLNSSYSGCTYSALGSYVLPVISG